MRRIAFAGVLCKNRLMVESGKMMSFEEIREKMKPLFKEEGLRFVLLFGSAAQGRTHGRSDIDLAFSYDGPLDIVDLTNKVIGLLHSDSIDVVDLRRASPLMRFSAVKTGKLLYERTAGLFHEYCSFAFRIYADTKKLRDARVKAIELFLEMRGVT